jgi:hypothetical protein
MSMISENEAAKKCRARSRTTSQALGDVELGGPRNDTLADR